MIPISLGMMVALLSLLASLFLAVRAWRAHGMSFENGAWMAVVWVLIIAFMAFLASRYA